MSANRFERPSYILIFAGLGCFLLSFLAMGLAPWTSLKNVTKAAMSDKNPYYDENGELNSIGRGRKIYIREGCWHCHSQFVRPVAGEPFRYGPTSQAFETMYDVPHTFGTRRVGPDLSREAGRRTDDWHLAHFYNPRSTVPLSVMPSYKWLFQEVNGKIEPKPAAQDLVDYMQYLGRHYASEIQEIVYPKLFKVSGSPTVNKTLLDRGQELFQEHCVGCHGQKGDGNGLAVNFLRPKAADLVRRYVSTSEVYSVLNRGVLGSAMPSFREMPEKDLWAIAQYVSSMGEKVRDETLQDQSLSNSQLATTGQKLYVERCSACHGTTGAGDGPAAAGLNPRPKDFSRRVFEKAYFAEILANGVPGSAMVPAADIKGQDLDAIFVFVTNSFKKDL